MLGSAGGPGLFTENRIAPVWEGLTLLSGAGSFSSFPSAFRRHRPPAPAGGAGRMTGAAIRFQAEKNRAAFAALRGSGGLGEGLRGNVLHMGSVPGSPAGGFFLFFVLFPYQNIVMMTE